MNDVKIDGFNDGYNKANEWHYPSKGEYPKDNSFVLVWTMGGGIITTNYGEEYSDGIPENGLFQGIHISDVIAWKEIVLPELPIPEEAVRKIFEEKGGNLETIAEHFNVSLTTAKQRLINMGLRDE